MIYTLSEINDLVRSPQVATIWPAALMLVGNARAHLWQVAMLQNGVPIDLSDATAVAKFRRSADGVTVVQAAAIDGNVISVQLHPDCYRSAGRLTGMLELTVGSGETVVNATAKVTYFDIGEGAGDQLSDPENLIPSIGEITDKMADLDQALQDCQDAADAIDGMTLEYTVLEPGADPTAAISDVDGHKQIDLGLSTGATGDPGVYEGTEEPTDPAVKLWIDPSENTTQPMPTSPYAKAVDGEGADAFGSVALGAVRYTAQTLEAAQQAQARANIAALGTGDVVNALNSEDTTKALSAAQGKALKDSIPGIVDALNSDDTTKALSAKQGKVLFDSIPTVSAAAYAWGSYAEVSPLYPTDDTFTQIPLNANQINAGALTFDANGNVVVGAEISAVLVNACVTVKQSDGSTGDVYAVIRKNSTDICFARSHYEGNTFAMLTAAASCVVAVAQGDVITIGAYKLGGTGIVEDVVSPDAGISVTARPVTYASVVRVA